MIKSLFTLIVLTLLAINALSQQPIPTPRPAEEDVVKISTNLIQIDVTVTDKNGKIIRDLKPEDFEIFENGQKQPISNFSFINNSREVAEVERRTEKPQPTLPPSPVRPEQIRRTVALIVDDLTLSFESTYFARRALKRFVDEQMQDGDLVAIIRTGAGIGALQQFTNDKRQLLAAIEKVRWNPMGAGKIGAFAPLDARVDTGPTPEPQAGERTPEGIQREQESFRESIFATGTLGAINYVVRGMQELPGRKSIMLISDGFKLYQEDALGFRESGRVLQSLRRLVDMANRASVVIYTLDPRGLVYTGLTAADNTGGRSIEAIESALSDRRRQLFETQDGLRYLAQQTGGLSIINNNDLSGGIRRILDDQSYYLIGYVPDDETFDPRTRRFNKLEIKVKRPGLKVRYRSGFFGIVDEKIAALGNQPRNRILHALTSPFSVNQIALHLNALFGSNEKGAAFIRSLVHVRAQDMKFEELPDGSRKAVFDIMAIAFGDNGMVVDQMGSTYMVTTNKDEYERLVRHGFVYNFTFPMKKPGAYQLRVAFRDHGSDKLGSANQFVEVPNLKKDRLTLSGVVLENMSLDEWNKRNQGRQSDGGSDLFTDTSLKQFKRGTVLDYGLTVYNPKPGSVAGGNLESRIRLFRDGQVVFEGKPQKISSGNATTKSVGMAGSLMLGEEMSQGDYVLQIIVTDKLAKAKHNSASAFVQFEIIQ